MLILQGIFLPNIWSVVLVGNVYSFEGAPAMGWDLVCAVFKFLKEPENI